MKERNTERVSNSDKEKHGSAKEKEHHASAKGTVTGTVAGTAVGGVAGGALAGALAGGMTGPVGAAIGAAAGAVAGALAGKAGAENDAGDAHRLGETGAMDREFDDPDNDHDTEKGALIGGAVGGVASGAATGALAGGLTGPVGAAIGAAAGAGAGAIAGAAKDEEDDSGNAAGGAVAGGATGGIAGGAVAGTLAGGVAGPVGAALGAAAGVGAGALMGAGKDADQGGRVTSDSGWQDTENLAASQASLQAGYQSSQSARQQSQEEGVIPVVQENLEVGKRVVSKGGVRVNARTVERPVEESVQLREETAQVERHRVDRPATGSDLANLEDRTIEIHEMEERPVVQKTAHVVEEVTVGKRVQEHTEKIADTVRSTEVEVERLGNTESRRQGAYSDESDDLAFRDHFTSNYQASSESYEDYAPAYAYGRQLRSNARYQGRQWEDIESEARLDWETRNPGSSWERFKAAVRHAWNDKITS